MQIEITEDEKKVLIDILGNKYENAYEMLESALEGEEPDHVVKELKEYLSTLYEILLKLGPDNLPEKWFNDCSDCDYFKNEVCVYPLPCDGSEQPAD